MPQKSYALVGKFYNRVEKRAPQLKGAKAMYSLFIVDFSKVKTPDEYNTIAFGEPHYYFEKLRDVRAFVNCSLRRGRCGYYAASGNIEYLVQKASY